jgi:hypothetical protein
MPFSSLNLINLARRVLRAARSLPAGPAQPPSANRGGARPAPGAPPSSRIGGSGISAGDYEGRVSAVYAPQPDGSPDPGEVVWAWVPYEEDPSQGKDRPVLLIGRNGRSLLGLMLTSRDRNNASDADPDYVDIGTGAWDRQGRPSEVRLDRIVQLDPGSVRREGAVLDRTRFDRVAARLAARS